MTHTSIHKLFQGLNPSYGLIGIHGKGSHQFKFSIVILAISYWSELNTLLIFAYNIVHPLTLAFNMMEKINQNAFQFHCPK